MSAVMDRLDAVDRVRASLYGVLGAVLARAPDAGLLGRLGLLDGDDGELGKALRGLASAAREGGDLEREYGALFLGVGRGELMPYASFYLTGFLHQRPLARVREDMARLGLARAAGSDPEDHIAGVCDLMAAVIEMGDEEEERVVFRRHLEPWAGRFFGDLVRCSGARFYRAVGALGSVLLRIDSDGFGLEGS